MRTFLILLISFIGELLHAQSFSVTDNIKLYQINKREYYKCYKSSNKSSHIFVDGKKHSPQMDYLISSSIIQERIKEQWGMDYAHLDDFNWWFCELDTKNPKYKYMVVIDQPINPIAYLLDKKLQVDSIMIEGDGVLTTDNFYFTEQLYDCDESVHLNWYYINNGGIEHIAELKEKSFNYRIICDTEIPGKYFGNEGCYYFAIENKVTHKKRFYKILLKNSGVSGDSHPMTYFIDEDCDHVVGSPDSKINVDIQPYLGQSFPEWKKEYGYLVTPDNNFIKRIRVSYKGIEYELGISDNQTIQYIATSDKRFSVNGYKVGDVINKTHTRPGWGNYTKIDQEWYAAWFPENRNEETGSIQWFFKFKFEIDGTGTK